MTTSSNSYTTGSVLPGTIGVNVPKQSTKGYGIPGLMPKAVLNVDKRYTEFENIRFSLVQGWNTNYKQQLSNANKSRIQTPFRTVNNAGDLLCRKDYSCGGDCQTFQSRPGVYGLSQRFGAILNNCDGTNVPPAACNTKFVYDSSDYTTYRKQSSMANNFNDLSFGGDKSHATQSVIRNIRRR